MKKFLRFLGSILIALLSVFIVLLVTYAIDPSYDMNEPYTKEMVQELLNKRFEIANVYAKHTKKIKTGDVGNPTLYSEFYIKGNKSKVVSKTENGKAKIYQEDKETNKIMWIDETTEKIMNFNSESMGAFKIIQQYDIVDLSNYVVFKFLGETKIDSRKNAVILLKEDDSLFSIKDIVFIDMDTGLISKHIKKGIFINLEENTEIIEDTVVDEDVEFIDYKINYSEYQLVKI